MNSIGAIIAGGGYIAIFFILLFETAVPIFFFLPGDSLLFVAGFMAAAGRISLGAVIGVSILSAIIGGEIGYRLGKVIGNKLFTSKRASLISEKKRIQAENFYAKYGTFAVIGARFIPIIRTFMSALAGIAKMSRRKFFVANSIGGILWGTIVPIMGYFIGQRFPRFIAVVPFLFVAAVLVSTIPVAWGSIKKWVQQKQKK